MDLRMPRGGFLMRRLYIGTYTRKSASKGIYAAEFDPIDGALILTGDTPSENPSFIATNKAGTRLYTVNESPGGAGNASAYAVETGTGALSFLGMVSAHGVSPCFIGLDASERFAILTNYSSGTIALYPLDDNGALTEASSVITHEGASAHPKRQTRPYAHSFILDDEGRVIVADLGMDKLMVYRIDQGGASPSLVFEGSGSTPPCSGPRHMVFDAGYKRLYVAGEIASNVTVFAYDSRAGSMEMIQCLSALPEGFDGNSTAADIHLSPDGRYLYTSNRGHDSIAVFSVDPDSGKLAFINTCPSGGKTPRNFVIDPSGRWLLAANQDTGNICVFSRDAKTGTLEKASEISVPTPVMILFMI